MDVAKHTDLLGLLPSLGYTLKRIGSYYTTAEMDSIRNVVTYTAVFGSTEAPKDSGVQDGEPVDASGIKRPLMIGGAVLVLALGGAFVYKKIRRR